MRKLVCLNGEWDFMPVFNGRSPKDAISECIWEKEKILVPSSWKWKKSHIEDYEPYDLFNYPSHWNDSDSGVLGTVFEVFPETNERVFLIFKGVLQNWQLFINDLSVLESQEAFLPVEIDITDYINRNGINTLKVWCGPFKTIDTSLGKKQVGMIGSWFAQESMGIWQDVFIEYRNDKYLLEPVVRTSYRNDMLEAEIQVMSHDINIVHFSISDENHIIKSFEGKLLREENGVFIYKGAISWKDAILWMPETPYLYNLKSELKIDNSTVDVLNTTFGFREVWCEANNFYINGIRVNLRGDSWHYQGFAYQTKAYALNWYKLCKDSGVNFVRLHAMPYPEFFLEAADEVGMLIIDESAIYGSSKKMQADNIEFIQNCKNHLEALVKRDRNHPSIIMWSMQNEMRWVDGRDGYKIQMKMLIEAIKSLDHTRPISFDGDNRLVAQEDMEIVSMHYNIDGTIESWDKSKPLAYGEHGKWHYISPQVASNFVGSLAYEDLDSCLLNMGREEELFIEHARKMDVTALCPFNIVYYMMNPMPQEDIRLIWDDTKGPGVKPRVIKKYSLTINNGLLKDYPIYTPNASYVPVVDSLRSVAIISDEYNTSFFEGRNLVRNYSIYNDTYTAKDVLLKYKMKRSSGEILQEGNQNFFQLSGERISLRLDFKLPIIKTLKNNHLPELLHLELELYHDGNKVFNLLKQYKIYTTQSSLPEILDKKILYIGELNDYEKIKGITGAVFNKGKIIEDEIKDMKVIIIGKNYQSRIKETLPILEKYVSSGGFLLIMEQEKEALGELVLSGKTFPNATISVQNHPVFKGLTNEDFSNWCQGNPIDKSSTTYPPVVNGFEKPLTGDLKILLECGDGDFGWGGLLWSAMLEYKIGKGRVILQQLDITNKIDSLPQAKILLENILQYGCAEEKNYYCKTGIYLSKDNNASINQFLDKIGIKCDKLDNVRELSNYDLIIISADAIVSSNTTTLKSFVEKGGKLLVLPINPQNTMCVEKIIDKKLILRDHSIYQFKSIEHPLTYGFSAFDSYHFEKVTYTPANMSNSIIAKHAIETENLEKLIININTPWEDLYVKNLDEERIKQATIQMAKDRLFEELCYGGMLALGKGHIIFSQLKLDTENDKLLRIYTRLFANLGAEVMTNLFSYVKEEKDFGIGAFMALPYEAHNDFKEEEVYFSHENYTLNNLGEGVYGWMKRVDKKNGFITVQNSKEKTYFLTLFIHSDVNRNPLRRESGELPDSSIVPDMLLSTNSGVRLFINGHNIFECLDVNSMKEFKIDDIILNKGLNRMAVVFFSFYEDIIFNMCFINKYGDFIHDLKYHLTID